MATSINRGCCGDRPRPAGALPSAAMHASSRCARAAGHIGGVKAVGLSCALCGKLESCAEHLPRRSSCSRRREDHRCRHPAAVSQRQQRRSRESVDGEVAKDGRFSALAENGGAPWSSASLRDGESVRCRGAAGMPSAAAVPRRRSAAISAGADGRRLMRREIIDSSPMMACREARREPTRRRDFSSASPAKSPPSVS